MNIYLVARFGNPQDVDGPDAEDTLFLVRAENHEHAGDIVDKLLETYDPSPVGRPVSKTCHSISLLGVDSNPADEPGLIHGPWIRSIAVFGAYDTWQREEHREGWHKLDCQDMEDRD